MPGSRIPVEIVFNPNWWFRNYGISFGRSFYFDRQARIDNDVTMRQALFERFSLGERDPEPRPVVGSEFVAGGFVVPALLGCEIRFEDHQAPCPVARGLGRDEAMALQMPDIETTWPMSVLIEDMDRLEREFGFVIGDFNTDGVLNTALQIRGNQFFLDLQEDPELVEHLCRVIVETQVRVAEYVRARTGTCSVAVNRSITNVDRTIYVHANCSTQMVSPAMFRRSLLGYERELGERLRPYGIHHCGDNLHLFVSGYAESGAVFYDVGWGSDVARCSKALPDAFLNLRLSPIRMLQCTPDEVRGDIAKLLEAAARTSKVGLCAINMDFGTPDENVNRLLEAT